MQSALLVTKLEMVKTCSGSAPAVRKFTTPDPVSTPYQRLNLLLGFHPSLPSRTVILVNITVAKSDAA